MYCAKAISLCSSRILRLKKANGDKGDNASSAEGGSERDATEFLTNIFITLEKKVINALRSVHVTDLVLASRHGT